jgi:putative SOS response-associated peptidase YedK
MCGRYTLKRRDEALMHVAGKTLDGPPRYNVAPTQTMPVVLGDGERSVVEMPWGLVPFYARNAEKPKALINARSETALAKAAFKRSVHRRRCLAPADGFFEWEKTEPVKTPWVIGLRDDAPFAFAAIYEEQSGYCLLTTAPNALMSKIHDRMPVIVRPEHYDLWLAPGEISAADFARVCEPFDATAMVARTVSRLVNSPKNDGPEILDPA